MKKPYIFLLSLLIMGLTGCEEDQKRGNISELLEPVGVQMYIATVKKDEIYTITTYDAEIIPYVEELMFYTDGTLESMNVMLGEMVQKGQVLAALSEEKIVKQIDALEEEIAHITKLGEFSDRQDQADIGIAEVELAILKESGASQQACVLKEVDVQKRKLNLEQTRELRQLELQEKQNTLKNLRGKLGGNQIVAPFDGRIVYARSLKAGDAVQGYKTMICIADETRMGLSSDHIADSVISGADKVYARIRDKEYDITYVPFDAAEYITLLLAGEEIKTRFTVDAEVGELENGQYASIVVLDSYKDNVLTIPGNALYGDAQGKYVYRLVDDQRLRCNVKVGISTDVKAEILEGLKEGDRVYVKE